MLLAQGACAQAAANNWEAEVRSFDARYWKAFNDCDMASMATFNTSDLEFYHDVGGVSYGRARFEKALKNNICSNPEVRLRRAAVADSVKVFPLRERGVLYGAIVSGEHQFYNKAKGKDEELTGQARFTHVLLVKKGVWQVSRVLSFDHGAAPYANQRVAVEVPAARLDQLAGTYRTREKMLFVIKRAGNALAMDAGGSLFTIYPSDADRFFVKERDLTMTFTRRPDGQGQTITVHEKGEVVEEANAVD